MLRVPTLQERQRGSLSGAVVTGLGAYDGALSASDLTDAVRTGVLRYLLQVIDVLGKDDREVPLAALLLGYNSSANLTRRRRRSRRWCAACSRPTRSSARRRG